MAEPESDEAILQLVERLEEVGAGSLRYQLQMAASKIERLEGEAADLRRRPTIREHIVAVKAAYEEGYDLGVSLGAAEPRYWGTSEARGLLAQCWLDEVEAVDRQDAAPAVRTHWLRNWRPVCGADPGEPSGRVIDEATTCLRCLEVIDRALEASDG